MIPKITRFSLVIGEVKQEKIIIKYVCWYSKIYLISNAFFPSASFKIELVGRKMASNSRMTHHLFLPFTMLTHLFFYL